MARPLPTANRNASSVRSCRFPTSPTPRFVEYDSRDPNSKFPPIEPLRLPQGAPHVLIVLLDDVGFGASSVFGGPCQTPTAERLAAQGLHYLISGSA